MYLRLLWSIVELCAADLGKIIEQAGIGGRLAHDAAQLGGGNPGVPILGVGEDVGDWAAIDGQRQTLTGFQL